MPVVHDRAVAAPSPPSSNDGQGPHQCRLVLDVGPSIGAPARCHELFEGEAEQDEARQRFLAAQLAGALDSWCARPEHPAQAIVWVAPSVTSVLPEPEWGRVRLEVISELAPTATGSEQVRITFPRTGPNHDQWAQQWQPDLAQMVLSQLLGSRAMHGQVQASLVWC
jgi:hypothetical protein